MEPDADVSRQLLAAGLPAEWHDLIEMHLMPYQMAKKPCQGSDVACYVRLCNEIAFQDEHDRELLTWNGKGARTRSMLACEQSVCLYDVRMQVPLAQHLAYQLQTGDILTAVHFTGEVIDGAMSLTWSDAALLFKHGDPSVIGCSVDLFAGIGGWTLGRRFLDPFVDQDTPQPAFGIEKDWYTANLAARMLGWTVMRGDRMCNVPWDMMDELRDVMICSAVDDSRVLARLSVHNLVFLVGSPSCQPWSSTARRDGLACELGMNVLDTAIALKQLQVPFAALENVIGMQSHHQWSLVRSLLKWAGYEIAQVDKSDIKTVRPITRRRLIIHLIRRDLNVAHTTITRMSAVSFPSAGPKPTLGSVGAILENLSDVQKQVLAVSQVELRRLLDPLFLPTWERNKLTTEGAIRKFRVLDVDQQLPALMASYRSNLAFADGYLKEQGLHAFVIQDKDMIRFLHCLELAAILGFPASVTHCITEEYTFRAFGNCLAPIHAAHAWYKMIMLRSEVSAFAAVRGTFLQVCKSAESQMARWSVAHAVVSVPVPPQQWTPITPTLACNPYETLRQQKRPASISVDETSPKIAKPLVVALSRPDLSLLTCPCANDMRVCHPQADNGEVELFPVCAVTLTQADHQWAWCGTVCTGEKIAHMLERALPGVPADACAVSVKGFHVPHSEPITEATDFQIVFPKRVIGCRVAGARKSIDVEIAPFMTTNDLCALACPQLGISLQCVRVQNGLAMLSASSLVWNYPAGSFVFRFFPLKGGMQARRTNQEEDRDEQASASSNPVPTNELWYHDPISGRVCTVRCVAHATIGSFLCDKGEWPCGVRPFCNGRPISLNTPVVQCPGVVSFRLFPVKGGTKAKGKGKGKVERQSNLEKMLIDRGVPEAIAGERAANVIGQISADAYDGLPQDETFWAKLKELASKSRVRLILPSELKQHQKSKRSASRPPPPASSGASTATGSEGSLACDVCKLSLLQGAFRAQEKAVPRIMPADFRTDSTGVCLMTPEQARHFLPPKHMSSDGLAILTTRPVPECDHMPIQFTVKSEAGSVMLLQGHLVQYGDHDVSYDPQCPALAVQEVRSTTLEILVERKCSQWGAAAHDVVTYISRSHKDVKCSEGVINKWRLQIYDNRRQACRHDSAQATHLHGYVRVRDEFLLPFLALSGQDHVFVTVKSDHARFDERFSVVATGETDLQEVLAKAQTCSSALGVVKLRVGYGIRCKRESHKRLRKELNPDAVVSESDTEDKEGAKAFRLCNVRMQTTKQALTQALRAQGWQASVIRATGSFTWLVRANDEPKQCEYMINGHLAIIVPDRTVKVKSNQSPSAVIQHAPSPIGTAPPSVPAPTVPKGPTAHRIDQIQTDLEAQIAKMVEDRFGKAAGQIASLEEEMGKQKEAVEFLQQSVSSNSQQIQGLGQKLDGVQQEVHKSGSEVISGFKSLMDQMRADNDSQMRVLNDKLDNMQPQGDQEKRRRVSPAPAKSS